MIVVVIVSMRDYACRPETDEMLRTTNDTVPASQNLTICSVHLQTITSSAYADELKALW